jgi:glycosyltransferase involved in cell wall biosynthesis
MHVAYIHQHFVPREGMSGTRSYELGQRLLRAGHRVTIVFGANDREHLSDGLTERVAQFTHEGLNLVCINTHYSYSFTFAQRILAFKRFADRATHAVCELDADLVFATSTPLTVGIPGMKAAGRLGVPFVFEVRDLWPDIPIAVGVIRNPMLKWYLYRLERRIYFAADHIIALSPGIEDGVRRTGYPAGCITMIPNGSDLDLFQPTRAPLDDERFGPPEDFRLVFTGAHGQANGLDAVMDAARELKRRGVNGIRFVFIGDGKLKAHLIERSRRENTAKLCSFVPSMPKPELARILPRMDAGLMILKNLPVFYYGTSPNKFFDYIAGGLPVLNNYPGWLADMITEHRLGQVVPPDDPQAFADAVLWLRDNPDERRAMGQRGRQLAEAQFSRDWLGTLFVSALEDVRAQWNRA